MTRIKFNPQVPSQQIFGDLFNDLFNNITKEESFPVKRSYSKPAVNILEEKDMFVLELAVPGVDKKDINIQLEKNELIISSGLKDIEVTNENKNLDTETKFEKKHILEEYNYKSFKRVFTIPKSINKDEIDAQQKNGVLTVKLKKKEEEVEKGPIEIKVK